MHIRTSEVALQLLFMTGAMFGVVLRKHAGYMLYRTSIVSTAKIHSERSGDLRTWSIYCAHAPRLHIHVMCTFVASVFRLHDIDDWFWSCFSCQFSILLYCYCVVTGEITLTTKLWKPMPGDSCISRRLTNTK